MGIEFICTFSAGMILIPHYRRPSNENENTPELYSDIIVVVEEALTVLAYRLEWLSA